MIFRRKMMMRKSALIIPALTMITALSAQEVLKSAEEEYYDYLSLTGVTERPALGYRTLSDSTWLFGDVTSFEENDDGTFTRTSVPGAESVRHIWSGNNLGSRYVLWESGSPSENWFVRGLNQNITLRIYGPDWFNSINTAAPYGQNDGALWQGKGYNTSLSAGARLEAYGFELTLRPQLSFSQNLAFEHLPGVYGNEYSYFTSSGGSIDLVQRYGDSAFWNFDWGDTEARWTWKNITVGFGTQNPWLGPAYLNPMLGSNNAPGYPKLDFGLRKTRIIIPGLGWNLGTIESRVWVGKLSQSDYFSSTYPYDTMINALSASYAPSFIPGLTIGLNRIFLNRWDIDNLLYFGRLFTFSRKNDTEGDGDDQKISIFADWMFPKIGFEFYFEYGFDDFSTNRWSNTFHTGIYTVGVKQDIPIKSDKLRSEFNFEVNFFEMSQDFQLEWCYGGFYTHGKVANGYTNKGQILGAGSGSFGNSQFIQYKLYYPKGSTSIFFHRYCPNINFIYNKAVYANASAGSAIWDEFYSIYETYFAVGLKSEYFVTDSLLLSGGGDLIVQIHKMYQRDNNNVMFSLNFGLKYNF